MSILRKHQRGPADRSIPYDPRRLERNGKSPLRICLGENSVGWVESEVLKWIACSPGMAAPSYSDSLKQARASHER